MFCFLLILAVFRQVIGKFPVVSVVSIVDETSTLSCLLKIHSIIKSTHYSKYCHYKFLVFESVNFTIAKWNEGFSTSFPLVRSFESKRWVRPESLSLLTNEKFDKDVIFARFYLAHIFDDTDRIVYLDNDIIVTGDIFELFMFPLVESNEIIPEPRHVRVIEAAKRHPEQRKLASKSQHLPAVMGFVFEKHHIYKDYLHANFNMSHPMVISMFNEVKDQEMFLNGGVFLMDTKKWREQKLTEKAEEVIKRNAVEHIYSSSIGDQAVFYLLLHGHLAMLPAKFNMRRLPKKTIHMLEDGQLGIVHFAGTTHGDAEMLCREPLKYPIFTAAAAPLYLSVVVSYMHHCRNATYRFSVECKHGIEELQTELRKGLVQVKYNAGLGNFRWPPLHVNDALNWIEKR